jgi:hypothetical protein
MFHDEVNFAMSAAEIVVYIDKTLALQEAFRFIFDTVPLFLGRTRRDGLLVERLS